jgi:membrane-associated protease RseP (regulator of RpoE activity)
MNLDLIFAIIFGLILLVVMRAKKKNVEVQKILFPVLYFVLYRAKWGLKFMDRFSKKAPKVWRFLEYVSIVLGFGGMLFITGFLIRGLYQFLFLSQPSPINILLPGVEVAPGVPIMSFWYWIIVIFILATVHEASHGIFARLNKIKLKSSGFAILGIVLPILPAAFVEPDEKQLSKAKVKSQLSVLSAGSFANIITAFIAILIFTFIVTPGIASAMSGSGVMVAGFNEEYPIVESGISEGEQILIVNGENVEDVYVFVKKLKETAPGEKVNIITDEGSYEVELSENPENSSAGYLGINITPYENRGLFKSLIWIRQLFFWLFVANLGVGLFNLLPMGPLDGGRMLLVSLIGITKNEKLSKKIFVIVSFIFLALIIIGLLPQILKLFSPLLNLF